MEGFDYKRAKIELKIPDSFEVRAMFAVGKMGKLEDLSKELQDREFPSSRKKVSEFAFEGPFRK